MVSCGIITGSIIDIVGEHIKVGGDMRLKHIMKKLAHHNVINDLRRYNTMLDEMKKISYQHTRNEELKEKCMMIKSELEAMSDINEGLIKVFALIREVIYRVFKYYPYDVQILAGLAMNEGNIIEMKTGEGKTLASVFPICFQGLQGNKVEVFTVNDYLAKRDCCWMGEVYKFFGLSVGYIQETMTSAIRKSVYKKDIVYLTVKEAGFDYLKNFISFNKAEYIPRSMDFVLIDEADHVLIDEARVPMVIAKESKICTSNKSTLMKEIVGKLKVGEDFDIEELEHTVSLKERGIKRIEEMSGISGLYATDNIVYLNQISFALEAEFLYKRDIDYVVREEAVIQIDIITGRKAINRQWSNGLQQAIELKENIIPQPINEIISQISIENYIKLYKRVSGMTGTMVSSANELEEKYGFNIVQIPTNKKCKRLDYEDSIYLNKVMKYEAIFETVIAEHKRGRPILIGTPSIKESEWVAERLRDLKVEFQILNAKDDEREANIIANAGDIKAITVSTNMAGRGTDIKLGGLSEANRSKVIELGGLLVIGTTRYESMRVDHQLMGRAGRQGDIGESRFFISLEDELIKKYGTRRLWKYLDRCSADRMQNGGRKLAAHIKMTQRMAEAEHERIRRNITMYSLILEQQRKIVQRIRDTILFEEKRSCLTELINIQEGRLWQSLSTESFDKAQRKKALLIINKHWSQFLEEASDIRQTAYLVSLGKKNPVDENNRRLIENYEVLLQETRKDLTQLYQSGEEGDARGQCGVMEEYVPSTTLTYLLNDSPESLGMDTTFQNPFGAITLGPFYLVAMILKSIINKNKVKRK